MDSTKPQLADRVATSADYSHPTPVHVVWELTLACNLSCQHCGSRAGKRRPNELTTAEALSLVDSLAELGTRHLSVIGGEAYLRPDWLEIIRHASELGITCTMQTGGRALNEKRLKAAKTAGLSSLGVSIDGLADLHDEVRGVPGAFEEAVKALRTAHELGISTTVNTQVGARTIPELPQLLELVHTVGATHWQIQLTVAMGNAVDNDHLLLQPYQLLELMPLLAKLYFEARHLGILMLPGNNIGYFGPYEHLWRHTSFDAGYWTGCEAGHTVLGIESDGTIKGCPSLATAQYAVGNIRDLSLEDMWNAQRMKFRRAPDPQTRWGFCDSCYYGEVCDAGCTWTTQSLLGKAGNNPYCHHRAIELERSGLRERVVKIEEGSPMSFGTGLFELIVEHTDGTPVEPEIPDTHSETRGRTGRGLMVLSLDDAFRQVRKASAETTTSQPEPIRQPPDLRPCGACNCYIKQQEQRCPFCDTDVNTADALAAEQHERRQELINQVRDLLAQDLKI